MAVENDANLSTTPLLATAASAGASAGKAPRTPLPKFQLFLLCVVRLVEPVAYTQIFPYVNDMCLEMGFAKSEKEVGFVSGLLDSIFAAVQLLTVLYWGRLSDKLGRRPVLILGLCGISLSTILFGLSRSLWIAILSRCLAGAISGNGVVIQSMMSEMTDDSNEAQAFPLYALMFSIGSVIGPFIGGSLARPAEHFPALFGVSNFWKRYPFLLPCLASTAITILALIATVFFLRETLPSKIRQLQPPLPSPVSYGAVDATPSVAMKADAPSTWSILRSPAIPAVLLAGFLAMFIYQAWDVVFILFAYTSVDLGGLFLSNAQIGYCLGAAGVVGTLIQLLVFPPLERRFGISMYPYLLSLVVLMYGAAPLLHWFVATTDYEVNSMSTVIGTYAGVAILLTLSRTAAMLFPLHMILVKKASPSKTAMGATYGLFAMVTSAARATSPWFVSSLFAWSIEKHLLDGKLVWLVMALISMAAVGASSKVKGRLKAAECERKSHLCLMCD